jgi:ArsR family transcriptional regulator, arsenate/arsenite/antimonite-responsive transcriptional repressor
METTKTLAALSALAQEHRLAIFRLLVRHAPDGLPAGIIGARLNLAPATLSFHLKELARAGLIVARQEGRFIWYRPDFQSMNALVGYLTTNCCEASAVCDPECFPAAARKTAAVALPQPTKRNSA